MKFHSVTDSVNPQKEAERESIAKQVAEWQARNGAIPVIPLRLATAEDAVCKQAFTISKPKVAKQAWKEGTV